MQIVIVRKLLILLIFQEKNLGRFLVIWFDAHERITTAAINISLEISCKSFIKIFLLNDGI